MTTSTRASGSGRRSTSSTRIPAISTSSRKICRFARRPARRTWISALTLDSIADGKYDKSLAKIRERLPFALSIGRVCPHPCETACNRGYMDEPISICTLKRYVADYEMKNRLTAPVEVPDEFHKEKVAIIGAGPAGLSCAYFLGRAGYHSVVFEALPEPGGMFRYGIPEYRLPTPTLMHEINWILAHGVELRCNTRIGKDISFEEIMKQIRCRIYRRRRP